jgi:hypothetical protein
MALQTFTAGQVLTAAQVNALQANDYNQTVSTKTADYVLVAADKGTRVVMNSASAQTITVNTDLFNAGDTLFIQNIGAGVCTITAGTATVSSAGSLALAQNAGGTLYFTSAGVSVFFASAAASASGLTLISATTIGTAVASVTVTGAFSTTYDAYKIVISGGSASATEYLNLKLGAITSGVDESLIFKPYAGALSSASNTNQPVFSYAGNTFISEGIFLNADIVNPFLAKYTTCSSTTGGQYSTASGFYNGIHKANTSFTDFTIAPFSGTLTGGTIYVYGYAKV